MKKKSSSIAIPATTTWWPSCSPLPPPRSSSWGEHCCRKPDRGQDVPQRASDPYARGPQGYSRDAGRPAPAPSGADRGPEIHGVSGLDGADLPEPGFDGDSRHAVDFIIQTIMGSQEPVTLVPTGPLTNVALALLKEPGLARAVSAHRARWAGRA